jgi:hypothetical protein
VVPPREQAADSGEVRYRIDHRYVVSAGGFAGPYAIGWIKDATGDVTLGLVVLAAGPIMAGAVAFLMGHDSKMEMAGNCMIAR